MNVQVEETQTMELTGLVKIQSRFGEIEVSADQAVFFPHGLLGLKENLHFVLVDIPGRNMGQFRLLQCMNDHNISFVVLPIDIDNRLISRKDIEDSCSSLKIDLKNLLSLLIVSIKKMPEAVIVTANARAPILIDIEDKAAIQYVFPHNRYDVQTLLTK